MTPEERRAAQEDAWRNVDEATSNMHAKIGEMIHDPDLPPWEKQTRVLRSAQKVQGAIRELTGLFR